jgi:hypothetical protein
LNTRRKIILIEILDIGIGGLLLVSWFFDAITLKAFLVLTWILQPILTYLWIKFVDGVDGHERQRPRSD